MSVTFSGFTNGGNNVTATLTAVSGGGSGTVTVALTTQVNETHAGSGTTTANSTVPASGNSVYEIWQPGDGLTTYFVRFDYGNNGGSSPQIKIQTASSSNGSGTLSGTVLTQFVGKTQTNSGSTLFNCLFSGTNASFQCMMWRDATAGFNLLFAIDRSKDASGNDTSAYVTQFALQSTTANAAQQQSLVFGVGASAQIGPCNLSGLNMNNFNAPVFSFVGTGTNVSQSFNGNIKVASVFPFVGYDDFPTLSVAHATPLDFSELATVTCTLLGSTHTYIYSKNQNFTGGIVNMAMLMRWE
jgi:hypothetical protein